MKGFDLGAPVRWEVYGRQIGRVGGKVREVVWNPVESPVITNPVESPVTTVVDTQVGVRLRALVWLWSRGLGYK